MAFRRRTRSIPRRSARGGRFQWVTDGFDATALTQNQQSLFSVVDTIGNDVLAGCQVVRVIGSLWVKPDDANAPVGVISVFMMMDADAFAAGASPELETDDAKYFDHRVLMVEHGTLVGGQNEREQEKFDFKPKGAKFRSRQTRFIHVMENISAGANALTAILRVRSLIWLP